MNIYNTKEASMIHVLHVIESLSLGGAARALMTCAEQCAIRDGSRHTVASLNPAKPQASLDHARQRGLEVLDAPDAETLRAAVANCDIVHVHYWNSPSMTNFLRMDLPAMRLLIKFNVGGMHPPHVITRDIVDFADMVQTTSPFAYDLPVFEALDPETRLTKVFMSYGAADFTRLADFTPKAHPGFNVTYLGTVDFVKMHPDYVRLSAAIRVPEARFLVCGGGAAFPTLEHQARSLGISDRFEFRREKEDIGTILSITDVFGYPLCEDNYSSGELVLQEVAYAGIPAVVLPHGGAGRLVINDFTGYVARSAAEYRDAIEHLHAHPEERTRLGRNAREYAIQLFGAQNGARITSTMYSRLMNQPKKTRILGAPEGKDGTAVSARLVDLVLDEVGATWAHRFIESLGETSPWFLASLAATNRDEQLEADERIARCTTVMAEGSLFRYRDHCPDDGFLRYWCGLVLQHRGEDARAAVEFSHAMQAGCDHWRVHWHLAHCTARSGDPTMAREALERALRQAPDFRPAQEMLAGLLDNDHADLSIHTLRLRRDTFLAANDPVRSEAAGRTLLERHANEAGAADVEAYYKAGLELHKRGCQELAQEVYRRVALTPSATTQITAWALFKHGELLLDQGNESEARSMFARTLQANPNHTKAALLLVPPTQPLCVSLDNAPSDACIPVPMKPLDEELWTYYFARRAPDFVRLYDHAVKNEHDATRLSHVLNTFLACDATVEVIRTGEDETIHQSILTESLKKAICVFK